MSLTTNLKKDLNKLVTNNSQQESIEPQIHEIAQIVSRENLELGCGLIKEAVIDKALTKVREDRVISEAIKKRQQAK